MAKQHDSVSVLGANTKLVGRLQGDHALRIEGNLRGDIELKAPLELASGGRVEGDVQAESVDIAGALVGDADASERIIIRKGASVAGKVASNQITVEPGSSVKLDFDMEVELDL